MLKKPSVTGMTADEKIEELRRYLWQLTTDLDYELEQRQPPKMTLDKYGILHVS